jgi:hypothetical protein
MDLPPEMRHLRRCDVVRGFVMAAGRRGHYRVAGAGPKVVMLRDSPRSSRRAVARFPFAVARLEASL